MNTTNFIGNLTKLPISGTHYIEDVCKDYISKLEPYIFYIFIFNLIYFLILTRIFNKIGKLNFFGFYTMDLNNIFENVFIIGNTIVAGLYVFQHWQLFDYVTVLKLTVKIIVFITIILIIYKNQEFIKKFFKEIKE